MVALGLSGGLGSIGSTLAGGGGGFFQKGLAYPHSTMNRAVAGTIRSESKYGTGGQKPTPIVFGAQETF